MSLIDSILKAQATAQQTHQELVAQKRVYSRDKINPSNWIYVAQALEEMFPGQYRAHEQAILNAPKTKDGTSSMVACFKTEFPVSVTITIHRTGVITGDGIDLAPILEKAKQLSTSKDQV